MFQSYDEENKTITANLTALDSWTSKTAHEVVGSLFKRNEEHPTPKCVIVNTPVGKIVVQKVETEEPKGALTEWTLNDGKHSFTGFKKMVRQELADRIVVSRRLWKAGKEQVRVA